MIKSGTTVSTPTAGNKECNDIKSYLPITKRPEQCSWHCSGLFVTEKCILVIFYPQMEPLMKLTAFRMSHAL
jgi:hypothetical protein